MKHLALALMGIVGVVIAIGLGVWIGRVVATTNMPQAITYQPLLRAVQTPLVPLPAAQPNAQPVIVYVSEPEIGSLQAQGFLLTAAYHVTTTVGVEREAVWSIWNGERVELDMMALVYAGTDLTTARYDSETRTITLPPSKLGPLDTDERATALRQQVSMLAPTTNDGALIKQARLEAEARIIRKACDAGLLAQAAQVAAERVRHSLSLVELNNVRVIAPAGTCEVAP